MQLLWIASVAAAFAAPRPCSAAQIVPQVLTNGASGRIYVYAILRNRSHNVCTVRARVTVTLLDARTRRRLQVAGNPYTRVVRARLRPGRLRPGRHTVFMLEWENYCGAGRPMLFVVRVGPRRAVERSHYPGARCETPSAPSRLRLFRLP